MFHIQEHSHTYTHTGAQWKDDNPEIEAYARQILLEEQAAVETQSSPVLKRKSVHLRGRSKPESNSEFKAYLCRTVLADEGVTPSQLEPLGSNGAQSSVQNSLSPVPNLDQPAARRGSGGGAGGGVGSDGAFLKANAQGQPKLRPSRIPQSKNRRTRALSERSRAGGSAPAAGAGFSLNNKVGSP